MPARIYTINQDFFKTWTPNSAWVFGWALGDGCFTNPLCLKFDLGRIDREVLEKFKIALESEHPIYEYKMWDKRYQKFNLASRIQFYSKELVTNLNHLSFYNILGEIFFHTLRGFFEAEGSVFWDKDKKLLRGGKINSSITNNDKDVLVFIWEHLQKHQVVKGGYLQNYKNTWKLKLSTHDSISLYHYIYDNSGNMFLKRKKERFEELIRRQLA